MVRALTCSRTASAGPVKSGQVCNSASRRSSRAEAQIHPFRIDVAQADLDDLRSRLAAGRANCPASAGAGAYR
jgi:hypothetical protein